MKASEIQVGGKYIAKVSGKLTTVRVDAIRETQSYRAHQPYTPVKRYDVTNLVTGRKTTFRSAAKFRSTALEERLKVNDIRMKSVDRYQGLKNGSVKPESLTEECIAAGTDWFDPSRPVEEQV